MIQHIRTMNKGIYIKLEKRPSVYENTDFKWFQIAVFKIWKENKKILLPNLHKF